MRTNTAATLYSPIGTGDSLPYTRTVLPAVSWQESAGYNVQKYGLANAFSATVYIQDMTVTPKPQDILIRGVCDFEVTGAKGASVSNLLAKGGKRIVTVDRNDLGSPSMHHWEVTVK